MLIHLGILDEKYNKVGKVFPQNDYILDGELKDSMDISNPSVLVDISDSAKLGTGSASLSDLRTYLFNLTYAYIPLFNRYYFIRKIIVVRKNLIQFDLHVDVLQFQDFIVSQRGYVSRNQYLYNNLLPDDRLIIKNTKTTTIIKVLNVATGSLVNTTFSTQLAGNTHFNVIINELNSYTPRTTYEAISQITKQFSLQNLPTHIDSSSLVRLTAYPKAITTEGLGDVLYALKEDDTLLTYVSSIYVYPFDIKTTENWTSSANVVIDEEQIKNELGENISCYIGSLISKPLIISHFKISSDWYGSKFTSIEPYTSHELYLPFYGWKEINISGLLEHEIIIYYMTCYVDGTSTVNIYDNTNHNLIFTAPCQLAIEVPKSSTNEKEVKDRRATNAISTALQIFGSAIAIAGGVASGNPLIVAGGVLGGTKALGSSITNEMTNYNRASIQLSDENNMLLSPLEVYLRRVAPDTQYTYTSDFLALNGGILNQEGVLSSFHGYTEVIELPYINATSMSDSVLRPTKDEIDEIISLLKKGVILPNLNNS